MLKLGSEAFRKAKRYVKQNARELDQALFAYYFQGGAAQPVIESLAKYQNSDGGFGHWLEPDFALKASSPLATTVAFQYLREVQAPCDLTLIRNGINYLLRAFDHEKQRWYAVSKEVNDSPHAPWWHYDDKTHGCVVDQRLGNPSAEIVGYLHRYKDIVCPQFLGSVTGRFVDHLLSLTSDATSAEEVHCYIRMLGSLPLELRTKVASKLRALIPELTELSPERWSTYCAPPVAFVESRRSPFLDLFPSDLERNLDFVITSQTEDGNWNPTWAWGQFEDTWEQAKRHWSGYLTVKNLKLLRDFDRIE